MSLTNYFFKVKKGSTPRSFKHYPVWECVRRPYMSNTIVAQKTSKIEFVGTSCYKITPEIYNEIKEFILNMSKNYNEYGHSSSDDVEMWQWLMHFKHHRIDFEKYDLYMVNG